MSIRLISKSLYTTHEVEVLAKNILNKLTEFTPANPIITNLTDNLSQVHDVIVQSSHNSSYNSHTDKLTQANRDRGLAFKAFYAYVKAGLNRRNITYRANSKAIMEYLGRFDSRLYRFGYSKQSVELRKLFEELENVADEIKNIQADVWLAELKEAEAAFLLIQEHKISEESANKVVMTTVQARQRGLDQLVGLVYTLNGLEEARVAGLFTLNQSIDAIIEDIEIVAKARKSKRNHTYGLQQDDLNQKPIPDDLIDLGE